MRSIALEEHFTLPSISRRIPKEVSIARGWPTEESASPTIKQAGSYLSEIGEQRLQLMDEANIGIQVLSVSGPGAELLPAGESVVFAQDYNNALAEKIALHPRRFAGFAHLPMTAPKAAAEELERAVKQLGFCGAMINGMTENLFLDDERFAPLLAKAEELKVPLYLHPSFPPPEIQEIYYGRLNPVVASVLASGAFGWHAEVAIHVLRLIASGTLDKYPKLQLIIGHMGETLPFMMYRAQNMLSKEITGISRTISEVLRSQVYITTSGIFTLPPLKTAIETFGISRILFSVDYPYSTNMQGKNFLDSLPLEQEELKKIAYANAERVLKLKI